MKLIVVPPLRLDEANGARTRTLEIYSRLKCKFEITFVVDRSDNSAAERHYLKLLEGQRTVNAYTGRNPVRLLLSLISVVRRAKQADAVFCYANYQPSVLYSYFVAKLSGKPLVITIHIIEESARKRSFLMNRALKYCSCLLALDNGKIVEELKTMFPGKTVLPIINGVDYDAYSAGRSSVTKTADCIFVGVLTERKGERDLLEIWRHVKKERPDASLQILAGITPREKVEAFRARAKEDGISEGLSIHSYMSEEAKIEAYRGSMVFVLPSKDEGMALVIPEAMAAGLPVVIWDLAPFEKIVKGTAKVQFHDTGRFAETILRLISDDEYRNKLRNEAQQYAKDSLSWDAAAVLEANSIESLQELIIGKDGTKAW